MEKHTTTVSGAMTATTLNTAANKACGANKKKFTLVFCHSDVSTGLENLNLIERLKYTDKDGIQRDLELGTWNGKLVIVTDQMPVSEGYFDADANTDGALKIVASGTPLMAKSFCPRSRPTSVPRPLRPMIMWLLVFSTPPTLWATVLSLMRTSA